MKKAFTKITATAFALILAAFWVSHPLAAEEGAALKDKTVFEYDGQNLQKGDIIHDFIDIAFSEAFWIEAETISPKAYATHFNDVINDFDALTSEQAKKGRVRRLVEVIAPWLDGYMVRNEARFPKQGTINKWAGEITIGIDWPLYRQGAQEHSAEVKKLGGRYKGWGSHEQFEFYGVIEKHITEIITDLKRATGLPVRFISPDSDEELGKGFARLRVVPVGDKDIYPDTKFTGEYVPTVDPAFFNFEYLLLGRVPLTPGQKTQVDGYLLPNADNTIGMAVCKVNPRAPEGVLRALIAECLIRSLGLPDISSATDNTLLGQWNKTQLVEADKLPKSFTRYDMLMARLLYCPEIKPGMDKYAALTVLAKSGTCVPKAAEK